MGVEVMCMRLCVEVAEVSWMRLKISEGRCVERVCVEREVK